MHFSFQIAVREKNSRARTGIFTSPHGTMQTPELAIVATEGEIKSIPQEYHDQLPLKYGIVNTFHILTKGLIEPIEKKDGIHTYGNFKNIVLASDSGGFQVFSLGFGKAHGVGKVANMFPGNEEQQTNDTDNPLQITDEGVTFTWNEEQITLTPESSIEVQHRIGADIIFAFDECTSPLNTKEYTAKALDRTHAWIKRCLKAHERNKNKQALFAIVQGGAYKDLREQSATFMGKQDVAGFGIGGSLGKSKEDMNNILEWIMPYLPDEKPRHLLGIGQVRDIFEAVERGVDLFDCVIPTREARHRVVYTKHGKVQVKFSKIKDEVIDHDCICIACKEKLTFKQLAELFQQHDPQAYFYATVHNIQFFADLMKNIRNAIETNMFLNLKESTLKHF